MSADNWAICPRCYLRAEKEKTAKLKKATAAYGVKPVEVYLKLREEAEAPIALEATFREDYEIGIDNDGGNGFSINYEGGCRTCGLTFSHKYECLIDATEKTK